MLMLLLAIDNHRYALNSQFVVEVLPLMTLSKPLQAPEPVVGLLKHRDRMVPIIDFCRLVRGTPCRLYFSTRIILLNCGQANRPNQVFGLLAERVTQMVTIADTQQFVRPDLAMAPTPYLGDVFLDQQGMIQYLHIEHLLPSISTMLPPLQPS